ncbi:hypothetical protein B0T14DRAFT_530889 [Immersiella caudata]|uniref:Uncharacterized protein n=1 Tax=Immersiella caudata TaxID=314043 RepID=A0AA39WAE1_9PEZI|nr:hypothetical protein B0T14DRAFT_530889 [Immersiella caudata]
MIRCSALELGNQTAVPVIYSYRGLRTMGRAYRHPALRGRVLGVSGAWGRWGWVALGSA